MHTHCLQQGLATCQVGLRGGGTRRSSFAVQDRKQVRFIRTTGLTRCQAASTGMCLWCRVNCGCPTIYLGVEAGADQSLVSQLVHCLWACLLDQRDASML